MEAANSMEIGKMGTKTGGTPLTTGSTTIIILHTIGTSFFLVNYWFMWTPFVSLLKLYYVFLFYICMLWKLVLFLAVSDLSEFVFARDFVCGPAVVPR
jgi:hypothetical protein